jgi:hypothetical protein
MSNQPKAELIDRPAPVESVAMLPPDLAIVKMENDSFQAVAAAHPRSLVKIKAELEEQLEAFPTLAEDAIYNKPVGKEQGGSGQQRYVRGLSVRSAEAIRECYGFNRVRTDVMEVDGGNAVKVEATFSDYQRCTIWQDSGIVSKFYKDRSGRMVKYADDRFYNVVVKAEASRRIREVILRSVNPGLKAWYFELAEKKIDEILDEPAVDKIVGKFSTKGISLEQLEKSLGRTRKAGWTKSDRQDLLGIWNAIESGETTIAEAFSDGNGDNGTAKPTGPVTAESLTNPKQAGHKEPVATASRQPGDEG